MGDDPVMRKYSLVAFYLTVLLLFLTGCHSNDSPSTKDSDSQITEEALTQELPSSENGVTITTEKLSIQSLLKRSSLKFKMIATLNSTQSLTFFLEKELDGTWYRVPTKADTFTKEGIVHFSGESSKSSMGIVINDLKYALTPS
jgi:hypothetical protein